MKTETKQRNLFLSIFIFVFIVFSIMGAYAVFDLGDYFKAILWLVVTILLSISLLMSLGYITIKNKNTPILVIMIAFIVFVLSVILPDYMLDDFLPEREAEPYRWSEIRLHEKAPEPVSSTAIIYSNTTEMLDMYVFDIYAFRFEDYIYECESMGYNVEVDKNDYSFNAFNEEGYELSLWFDETKERMEITLYAPLKLQEIIWPKTGLATTLPVPTTQIGKIESDSSYSFSVYIGNSTLQDFEDYIQACIDAGYNVDYNRYDHNFYAHDSKGHSLHIRYKGNQVMYINVYNE